MSELSKVPTTEPSDQDLRKSAIERLAAKRGFYAHLLAFVLVNALLIGIWAISGGGFFWPLFTLFGWGIGLAFNAFAVFSAGPTEDRIQAEIRRAAGRRTSP